MSFSLSFIISFSLLTSLFVLADDAKSSPVDDEVCDSADAVDDDDDDESLLCFDAICSAIRCFARVLSVLMLITSVLGTGNDDEIVSRLTPAIVERGEDATPHVDDE